MVDAETPQLSTWLPDPDLRRQYRHALETILNLSQSQPNLTSKYLTQYASTSIAKNTHCPVCKGSGTALDLVVVLRGLQKPPFRTTAVPGPVPHRDCRWMCTVCQGRKPVFLKTNDLRRHLGDVHGFSTESRKHVFDTKRTQNERLWEYFGPCTMLQAEASGWTFQPWLLVEPRGRAQDVFFHALGAESLRRLGAHIARTFIRSSTATSTAGIHTYPTVDEPADSMTSVSLLDDATQIYLSHQSDHLQEHQDDMVAQTGTRFHDPTIELDVAPSDTRPNPCNNTRADLDLELDIEDEQLPLHNLTQDTDNVFITTLMSWHQDENVIPDDFTSTPQLPLSPWFPPTEMFD